MIQIYTCRAVGRNPDNPSDRKERSCGRFKQRLEKGSNKTSNTISTVAKDAWVYIEFI